MKYYLILIKKKLIGMYPKIVSSTDDLIHYIKGENFQHTLCGVIENDDWEDYDEDDISHLKSETCPKCFEIVKEQTKERIDNIFEEMKEDSLQLPIVTECTVVLSSKTDFAKFMNSTSPEDLAIFLNENPKYFRELSEEVVKITGKKIMNFINSPDHVSDNDIQE
jgi:hypothetical protein